MKITVESIIGRVKFEIKYYIRLLFKYSKYKWYKLWGIKTFTVYEFEKKLNELSDRSPKSFTLFLTPEGERKLDEAARKFVELYNTEKDED